MELAVPKGMKARIKEIAKEQGYSSQNNYVVEAVKEKYQRDTGGGIDVEERVRNKPPAYIGWLITEDRSETIGLFFWENEKPELEEIEAIVRISDQNEYTTREITAREYTL